MSEQIFMEIHRNILENYIFKKKKSENYDIDQVTVKFPLTLALLQGDLGNYAEVSSFRQTVGHVEVEALRDRELAIGHLILPAAVVLLGAAHSLHPDVGVAVDALGLAELGKNQLCLHLRRN